MTAAFIGKELGFGPLKKRDSPSCFAVETEGNKHIIWNDIDGKKVTVT